MKDLLKNLLQSQVDGIEALSSILNENIEQIVEVLAKCSGHVVITGLGKSGIIGKKISATMSSIGIPSFFLCPFNATHGDIGMITKQDIVILISNSGNADELITINEFCKRSGNVTVGITRANGSYLASETNYSIVLPKLCEGNELDAPATSTTQTVVIGDILAFASSNLKKFGKIDYAKLHPSGSLGKKISKVTTIMETNFATAKAGDCILEITKKMTEYSNGFVCVTNNGKLHGIITDGDIRRTILKHSGQIQNITAGEICNQNPKFLTKNDYIIDAQNLINQHHIGIVVVVDENKAPVGFVSKYGI